MAGAVPRAAADVLAVGAAFATVSITYHWNEYRGPLMMLNDPDKQVLTVGWSLSPWAPNPAASGASAPGR